MCAVVAALLQFGACCNAARQACHALKDETVEQAYDRRVRESKRVEDRVTEVTHESDWKREMKVS